MKIDKETFLDWLKEQPDDREWVFAQPRSCVWACFMKEVNSLTVSCGSLYWRKIDEEGRGKNYDIPDFFFCFQGDWHSLLKPSLAGKVITAAGLKEFYGLANQG